MQLRFRVLIVEVEFSAVGMMDGGGDVARDVYTGGRDSGSGFIGRDGHHPLHGVLPMQPLGAVPYEPQNFVAMRRFERPFQGDARGCHAVGSGSSAPPARP